MGPYTSRLIIYLCLGLALALTVPLLFKSDLRMQTVTRPVVILSALALDNEALAPACPKSPFDVSEADLEKYPLVLGTVKRLQTNDDGLGSVNFYSDQARLLARSLDMPRAQYFCFKSKGSIYRLRNWIIPGDRRATLYKVGLSPQQPTSAPALSDGQLADLPALSAYLNEIELASRRAIERKQKLKSLSQPIETPKHKMRPDEERLLKGLAQLKRKMEMSDVRSQDMSDLLRSRPYFERQRSKLSADDFIALRGKLGGGGSHLQFRFGHYMVQAGLMQETERLPLPVPWLTWVRLFLGGALLMLALWSLRWAYVARRGFAVAPGWAVVFSDSMFVLGSGVLAWGFLQYVLGSWLDVITDLDQAVQVVMSWMWLPAVLIVAIYTANLASQSVEITQEGILRHGPGGDRKLAWDKIERLELRSTYVPVGRVGVLVPRKLQTKLVFVSGGERLEVYEPQQAELKAALLGGLREHAPERLAEDLRRIAQDW